MIPDGAVPPGRRWFCDGVECNEGSGDVERFLRFVEEERPRAQPKRTPKQIKERLALIPGFVYCAAVSRNPETKEYETAWPWPEQYGVTQ